MSVLELAEPLGWKDTFVRAAKTFIQVFVGGLALPPLTELAGVLEVDFTAYETLLLSAGSAAVSIILNKILLWARS